MNTVFAKIKSDFDAVWSKRGNKIAKFDAFNFEPYYKQLVSAIAPEVSDCLMKAGNSPDLQKIKSSLSHEIPVIMRLLCSRLNDLQVLIQENRNLPDNFLSPISIAKDMLFQSGRSSQSKIYRERHDFAYRMLIAEFASTQELMTKYVARRSMDFSLLTTGASI